MFWSIIIGVLHTVVKTLSQPEGGLCPCYMGQTAVIIGAFLNNRHTSVQSHRRIPSDPSGKGSFVAFCSASLLCAYLKAVVPQGDENRVTLFDRSF